MTILKTQASIHIVSFRSLIFICTFVSYAINLLGPFYAIYLEHFHVDIFMISMITAANPVSKIFFGGVYSFFSKHFHFDLEALLFSLILISLAYLGFGLSTSVIHILAVQIVIGASDAVRVPTENFLLSQSTSSEKCKYHFTLKSIGTDIAVVASLLSGGFIVNNFGFSVLFYVMSAVTTIPILAIGWKILDLRRENKLSEFKTNYS